MTSEIFCLVANLDHNSGFQYALGGFYFHGYTKVYHYGAIMNYLAQYEIGMMLLLNLFLNEPIKKFCCWQNLAKNCK